MLPCFSFQWSKYSVSAICSLENSPSGHKSSGISTPHDVKLECWDHFLDDFSLISPTQRQWHFAVIIMTGIVMKQPIKFCIAITFVCKNLASNRDHFVCVPSQWETMLHCNVISHWLGPYTNWSLQYSGECFHYTDVIMTTMASQITSLTVVYSTVYSDADQRKHQSSTSLAFVWRIHRDWWIPCTKGQLRGKCIHLMTSSCHDIMASSYILNAIDPMNSLP